MKTVFWVFLFYGFCSAALHAQAYAPSKAKQYLSLTGEVYFLSLFVDTDAGDWAHDEMDYFYQEFLKSQDWLQNQAAQYQRTLYFENDYFLDNKELLYLPTVWRQQASTLSKKIMVALGYKNLEDFLDQTGFDFKRNKLKIICFVKSNDRSHAIDYWSQEDVDIAVVYFRSTFGQTTDQYVISHEILHQFGAWDLYSGESQTPEKARLAQERYPHSVMIHTFGDQSRIVVDELTAWRIGWIDTFKEEYLYFTPERRNPAQERAKKKNTIRFDLKKKKDPDGNH